MTRLYEMIGHGLLGGLLGILLLGIPGRVIMRVLTWVDGRTPGFSWGGTVEILLYGGIVGFASGFALGFLSPSLRGRRGLGLVWGAGTYLLTLLTLPGHIAETAAPFADIIVFVHAAFGAIFLLFGWLLHRIARRYWP